MAQQGKKYTEDIREKALALRAAGYSVRDVSGRLGASPSTIRAWEKAITNSDPDKLTKLRTEKNAAFASRAWADCEAALTLISRRIKAAGNDMGVLERLIAEASEAEEITPEERRDLLRRLAAVRVDDIGKLSTVMGTLYDKSALAAGEATEAVRMTGSVRVERFEDL